MAKDKKTILVGGLLCLELFFYLNAEVKKKSVFSFWESEADEKPSDRIPEIFILCLRVGGDKPPELKVPYN